jgi:hypothetical protein
MHKILIAVLIVTLITACSDRGSGYSFTVSGTLKNTPSKMVYIDESNTNNGENIARDSAMIGASGNFSLKIKANHEGIYNLRLQNDIAHFATLINDGSDIKLNADFSKRFDFYDVSGSKASKAIQEYLAKLNEMQREKFNYLVQLDSIKKAKGDSLLADELNRKQKDISSRLKQYTKDAIEKSDNSSYALHILSTYASMSRDPNYRLNAFSGAELLDILNVMVNKFPDRTDIAGIRSGFFKFIPGQVCIG